ncbi:MAG: hypothetical protein GF398_13640 [Chitinivibrionales bacterium]|nr:hypothetical protein [Chitinivibrionales bacterium]
MATKAMIDEFLGQKKIALVRQSRSAQVHGFGIDTELSKKGYCVSVVYLDEAGNNGKLGDLKEPVDGVIVAVKPDQSSHAVGQAVEAGIARVWLQEGSESRQAIQLCEDNNISTIHGECVMMYAEPVKSVHAIHRWIWKVLGKLPK